MTLEQARARDREKKRRQRARRRAERDATWSSLSGGQGDAGDASPGNVIALPESPSLAFEAHVRRTLFYLRLLELDSSVSIAEKTRVYLAAIAPLARAVDTTEFAARLASVERRQEERDRRGLA